MRLVPSLTPCSICIAFSPLASCVIGQEAAIFRYEQYLNGRADTAHRLAAVQQSARNGSGAAAPKLGNAVRCRYCTHYAHCGIPYYGWHSA